MAMTATFYHFSKRNRSTKVPEGSGTTLNIDLKDSTSVVHPIIIVQTIEAELFNYCFLSNFNRYYFISDWVYIKGRWECNLTLDPLATYKAAILSTNCNVLYASGSTKNIVDQRIQVTGNILQDKSWNNFPIDIGVAPGSVMLGITGKGSFGCYLLALPNSLSDILDGVDNWWTTNVNDTWTAFKQLIFGGTAADCLKSAILLPFNLRPEDVSGGGIEQLYLGNYPCTDDQMSPIYGTKVTSPLKGADLTLDIPWYYNDWRKLTAFCNLSLYIPFIGTITLPTTELQNDNAIDISIALNVTSGDISVQVKGHTSGRIVANASGNCAMPTAFGSTGIDTTKLTASLATGIGTGIAGLVGIATGGITAAGALAIGAGMASGVGGAISAMGGTATGDPGLGGGSSGILDRRCILYITQKELTDTQTNFNPIMGKPFMGVSTPGAFSGYVQTDGFQFANDFATSTEKDTINKLMDSGVYIE